ncbi:hypothetical protein CMQ_1267 [Grosmannia clavigera kw1407]|uniref:Uncharacterized protein n=1 Tax=Grosmannia clavigera (strain kw1407 / UAMH 11150) TaxID=655863 RepID=F0XCC4_GROCL|nr:uncharacterized protein CMQ_1267 [Grosmannia clavigera kw1407]EFX04339.1 hypothetical protein CMQ_1267 [Grosmannia clavigera kw1407]
MRSILVAGLLMVGSLLPEVSAYPRIVITTHTLRQTHTAHISHTASSKAVAATVTKVASSFDFEAPSKLDINPHNKGSNRKKYHGNPAGGRVVARAEVAAPVEYPAVDANGDVLTGSDTLNTTGDTKVVDWQNGRSSSTYGASENVWTDLKGTGMSILKKVMEKIMEKIKHLLGGGSFVDSSGFDDDSDSDNEAIVEGFKQIYNETTEELESLGLSDD